MKRRIIIYQFPRFFACYFHHCHAVRLSGRPLSTASNHNNILSKSAMSPTPTTLELDFFGEPVTFVHQILNDSTQQPTNTTNAMEALDGFLLTVVSKGKSCIGGGDEAGIDVKPAHATSLSWAELLRHAAVWNTPTTQRSSPMLAVVAVAPLLAQAGVAYVRHLDTLLQQASPGVKGLPVVQMMDLATAVVETWMEHSDEALPWNERECLHVQALSYLLKDQHRRALSVVLKILQLCPGDLLALTLAMDLAQTIGDKRAALR
jgi:hypothetical protein